MASTMRVRKNFEINLPAVQALEALAADTGRSQNEIVNAALEEYLRRQQPAAPAKKEEADANLHRLSWQA